MPVRHVGNIHVMSRLPVLQQLAAMMLDYEPLVALIVRTYIAIFNRSIRILVISSYSIHYTKLYEV